MSLVTWLLTDLFLFSRPFRNFHENLHFLGISVSEMWQKYDNRMNICEKVCSWFIKLKSEVNRLERKLFRKDGSKMARKLARKLFLIRRATYKIDSICISSNGTLSRKSSQSSRIFRTFFHSLTKIVNFRFISLPVTIPNRKQRSADPNRLREIQHGLGPGQEFS